MPLSLKKIAHLLLVRAGEIASARYSCAHYGFLSNTDKILPRKRFVLMSGSEKFDLLMSES